MPNGNDSGLVDKVVGTITDTAKELISGPAGEVKALVADGSDDALRELASEFGNSYFSKEVFAALEEDGGEVAMSQISQIIQRKSAAAVCDEDHHMLSISTSHALQILENNGNEAAMRGVLDIMQDTEDSDVYERCEKIINNGDNMAVQRKMAALQDDKLPHTFEDHDPDELAI